MRGLVIRVVLAVTSWGWVRRLFTRTRVGRRVALRFVAGETLDEAVDAARRVIEGGAVVSLDLLGEHVTDAESAERAGAEYLACLERIAAEGLAANVSVKLTQLGMGLDEALCERLLDAIASRAVALGLTVTIDMEESAFTETTLGFYERAQRAHGNLGVAIQAYLRRTPDDLDRIIPLGGHVRLCKGAYDESEEVALRSRGEIDAAYDALLKTLMAAEGVMPAVATHDEGRVRAALAVAGERRAPWEFQMLYGIRGKLQKQLVADGRDLRVYIPFGEAWYPYLTRRIAERPANLWFFFRALFGR